MKEYSNYIDGELTIQLKEVGCPVKFYKHIMYLNKDSYECPTIEQVLNWLEKEYNIIIEVVSARIKTEYQFTWNIISGFEYEDMYDELPYLESKEWFINRKDAYMCAIRKSIELIKYKSR